MPCWGRLWGAVLVIVAVAGCQTRTEAEVVEGDAAVTEAEIAQAPTPEPILLDCPAPDVPGPAPIRFSTPYRASEVITIAAVGDVLLHDVVQEQIARIGYDALWDEVVPTLTAADLAYANLEGPTAQGVRANGRETEDPGTRYDGRVFTGYPQFNYHPDLVPELQRAGVDVVSTSNNHSLDRFALGADRTIEVLEANGLPFTGTRHRDRMGAPWHTVTAAQSTGGVAYNVAWLACTYGTNGIVDQANQVLHCYEQESEVLQSIRALNADPMIDAVIVTPHWGIEYTHIPGDRQVRLARAMLEAGATAVIGAHPHVIQPGERWVTQSGREGYAFYSLGNFVSNQRSLPRKTNLVLTVALAPDPIAPRSGLRVVSARHVPTVVNHRGGGDGRTIGIEVMDGDPSQSAARNLLESLMSPADQIGPTDLAWYERGCPIPGATQVTPTATPETDGG